MKRVILAACIALSTTIFAQQLPEGWDQVNLNGKPAYMNLVTGEITMVKPRVAAKNPVVKIEVDPSVFHKVKKGETLKIIAAKYGISLDSIYAMNTALVPENLQIGQEIKIGYDKSKEGQVIYKEVEDKYTDPSNNTQHFVKRGETLYSISRKHGLTVEKLKELNGLTTNTIEIGQKLILQK